MSRDIHTDATPSPRPVRAFLGRLLRLIRKEVVSILRDRRTIITLILMPVLLYPLLAIAFQQFFQVSAQAHDRITYRVCFRTEQEGNIVMPILSAGIELLRVEHRQWRAEQERLPRPNQPAGDETPPEPEIDIVSYRSDDPATELWSGNVDVTLRVVRLARVGAALNPDTGANLDLEMEFRDDSQHSKDAAAFVERLCQATGRGILSERLAERGVIARTNPIRLVKVPQSHSQTVSPGGLTVLIPLVLILMTMTGAVYPAIDLTAGERERGTLEMLVAAPIPRFGLLFAKYVAVFTVAMLTAIVNLATMVVTLLISGLGPVLIPQGLTVGTVLQVFGLMLLFAAFFSAVLLALTSCARSFKEAQAYLIPLMLAALLPGMLPLMVRLDLDGPMSIVPLLNIVLLARDLFAGLATAGALAVVVLSTVLYALAAVGVAARLFGAEAVLYSEQSGWGDLFRRPAHPRPAMSVSGAFLGVALMFSVSFLLTGLQAQVESRPLIERLALSASGTLILFAVLPLLAARLAHVRYRETFQLTRPTVLACLGALVVGVGIWPFLHDLLVLMHPPSTGRFPSMVQQKVEIVLKEWRDLGSPLLVVLVYGLIPAVAEELTFRGFLFTALRRASNSLTAVLVSALMFGIFHSVQGSLVTADRLVQTTLMGLVLGAVAWRTGSVFPGMLLHAAHNSSVVLLAFYAPWLQEQGWVAATNDYLPPLWLAAGGSAVLVGTACLGFGARRPAVTPVPSAHSAPAGPG